jgi:hypothetical protein
MSGVNTSGYKEHPTGRMLMFYLLCFKAHITAEPAGHPLVKCSIDQFNVSGKTKTPQ